MHLPWLRGKIPSSGGVATDIQGRYVPPPGINLVYSTLVAKLDFLDRTINTVDAKAGVLLGATAAAFGLVATSGGGAASLFLRYEALRGISLLVLAVAFALLLSVVLVQDIHETPDPKAFVRLANETEERIKELSLEALVSTYEFNRRVLDQKSGRLFWGQVVIGVFVGLVVLFELLDLIPKVGTVLGPFIAHLTSGLPIHKPTLTPTATPGK